MGSLFDEDTDPTLILLVVAMFIATGWFAHVVIKSQPERGGGRSAEGPGGYLDHAYNQQSNMSQTGVQDVQIPLDIRQEYARRHDLTVPSE